MAMQEKSFIIATPDVSWAWGVVGTLAKLAMVVASAVRESSQGAQVSPGQDPGGEVRILLSYDSLFSL